MDDQKDANLPFNLYDLTDRMRVRGWQVASYSLPTNCEDMVIQRVLIRHGFSHDMADLFMADLKRSIDYLIQHQGGKSLTKEEGQTFHH